VNPDPHFMKEIFAKSYGFAKIFAKTFAKAKIIAKTFAKTKIFAKPFAKTKIFVSFFREKRKKIFVSTLAVCLNLKGNYRMCELGT
jgi:hypothetical protein